MSIQWFKNNPGALAFVGLLLGLFIAVPACFAGGAATIIPDKHQLAPRGSYIPARRVEEVLKKIETQKAMLEKKKVLEQQENKSPKP
jgi:hypothetical protein